MYSPVIIISIVVALWNIIPTKTFDESEFDASELNDSEFNDSEFDETERIVAGETATAGQFPFAVALYFYNQFICTASIISPTTVLTAAHCIYLNGQNQPAESFYAIANVNRSAESLRIEFESIILHPDYNGERNLANDVAVMKTKGNIVFSDDVKPVCIAGPDKRKILFPFINLPEKYLSAYAIGWGNVSRTSGTTLPEMLQHAKQIIVSKRVCNVPFMGTVRDEEICAKGTYNARNRTLNGVCNGDSGGPLVYIDKKTTMQIGVSSYIHRIAGCATTVPSVWQRVSSYYYWIMQAANDSSICTVA